MVVTANWTFILLGLSVVGLIEGSDALWFCQLADIIWDEGSEADDQIVRYPENTGKKDVPDHGDNDKKKLTGGDTNRKAVEENAFAAKSFSDRGKGVSALRTMGAQHDFLSFSASRTDCNPIGTEICIRGLATGG